MVRLQLVFTFSLLFSWQTQAELESFPLEWKLTPPLEVFINKLNAKNPDDKLPALILFGGFHGGAEAARIIQVDEPLMVVTFQYPYKMKEKMSLLEKFQEAPKMRKGIHSMTDGIGVLVDALKKRPDVDQNKIVILGGSFGSPFAIHATSEINDITGLVLVHGFSDVRETIERQFYRHWKNHFSSFIARTFSRITSVVLNWYISYPNLNEMLESLPPSKKVLMIVAKQDEYIPNEVSQNLWNNLKKSKAQFTQVELEGSHVLKPDSPHTQKVTNIILDWMRDSSLL